MAFRNVPAHLMRAIRGYHKLPPFGGHAVATWTSPFVPRRIAVSLNNEVFAIGYRGNVVSVFTPHGVPLRQWKARGCRQLYNITVARTGEVVVVVASDQTCIHVYRADGTCLARWGSRGSGDSQFLFACGVATTKNGHVVVTDPVTACVQVFRLSDGAFLHKWGTYGTAEGQFLAPRNVCVTENDEVVVLDNGARCVQVYTLGGVVLRKWGTWSMFDCEWGITMRGNDVVVSTLNHIHVFRIDGTRVSTWKCFDRPYGQNIYDSLDVATLRSGQLLVHCHRKNICTLE